jgi:hypothetical protein
LRDLPEDGRRLASQSRVARINFWQIRILLRATLSFSLLSTAIGHLAYAQEARVIDSPTPTLEALEGTHPFVPLSAAAAFVPDPHLNSTPGLIIRRPAGRNRSGFALDRTAIILGLVQGTSEVFDGVTTKYFLHHCSTCIEMDPVSHFLLGSRPTWTGMIAAGSVEAFAATYLNQGMRHSPHKFVRQCAPLVPLLLTGIHLLEGARNPFLKNNYYCVNPGYLLVDDSYCVAPSSAPPLTASLPGLSANPSRISLLVRR